MSSLLPCFELEGGRGGGEPGLFRQALRRLLSDALGSPERSQAVAEVVFGMSSLSGILLDDFADATRRGRGQVLTDVHRRHLSEDTV